MDFQTRYLRYFLAVADELSFTRAAEHLAVSQPALSQRIQALEEQFGFPLLTRLGRGVALTPQGEALVDLIRGLMGYANRIERVAQDLRGERSRPLLIGAAMPSEKPERTALITAFTKAHPEVELELETSYTIALFQGLLDGDYDMILVLSPVPDERFEAIVLKWFPVEVIVPQDSTLADLKEVTQESLRGSCIVSFRRKRHPLFYDRLIQPLIDAGALVTYSPDQSPAGTLAYAATHDMVLPSGFEGHSDEDIHRWGMVKRPLTGVAPVSGLLLVRAKGASNKTGDLFWDFVKRTYKIA